jgi:hypothetical protein
VKSSRTKFETITSHTQRQLQLSSWVLFTVSDCIYDRAHLIAHSLSFSHSQRHSLFAVGRDHYGDNFNRIVAPYSVAGSSILFVLSTSSLYINIYWILSKVPMVLERCFFPVNEHCLIGMLISIWLYLLHLLVCSKTRIIFWVGLRSYNKKKN